jgi:hypothetical protein
LQRGLLSDRVIREQGWLLSGGDGRKQGRSEVESFANRATQRWGHPRTGSLRGKVVREEGYSEVGSSLNRVAQWKSRSRAGLLRDEVARKQVGYLAVECCACHTSVARSNKQELEAIPKDNVRCRTGRVL